MRLSVALAVAVAAGIGVTGTAAADPPAATRRLMRDLVAGKQPWSSVIDPARGVRFIGHVTDGRDEPASWRRTLCGAELRWFLRTQRPLHLRRIEADEYFSCRNRGDRPTCVIGDIGELMVARRFEFRIDGDRLVLDIIADVDSAYPPPGLPRGLARLRARAPATCPAS